MIVVFIDLTAMFFANPLNTQILIIKESLNFKIKFNHHMKNYYLSTLAALAGLTEARNYRKNEYALDWHGSIP